MNFDPIYKFPAFQKNHLRKKKSANSLKEIKDTRIHTEHPLSILIGIFTKVFQDLNLQILSRWTNNMFGKTRSSRNIEKTFSTVNLVTVIFIL